MNDILVKIHDELKKHTSAIKSWTGEDVSQHDARLKEYRKQTKLMEKQVKLLYELNEFIKGYPNVKTGSSESTDNWGDL